MKIILTVAFAASAAALAGCTPPLNETNFAAGREAVAGSPALFRKGVAECIVASRRDPKAVEMQALLTGLPKERASEVACQRVVKAYAEGRYKYQAYSAIKSGSVDPEMIRIIQGR